jgi:hypothetical protein
MVALENPALEPNPVKPYEKLLTPAHGTYPTPPWLKKYINPPPRPRPYFCVECTTPAWNASLYCIAHLEWPHRECRECKLPFGLPLLESVPTVPRSKSDLTICAICEVAPRYGNNLPSIIGHFEKLNKTGVFPFARLRIRLYRRERLTAVRLPNESFHTGSLLVVGMPGDGIQRPFCAWDSYQTLLCDVADLLWSSELVVMVKTRRVAVSDVSRALLTMAQEILVTLLRRERGRAAMLAN